MAMTPKPPAKPAAPPKHNHDEREDKRDERDAPEHLPETPPPPPAQTIADEQRQRSDEIARQGVEKWKAEHDERTAEEKAGRQVPGVASPAPVEGGTWQGSLRTTPPARAAQNPSASR